MRVADRRARSATNYLSTAKAVYLQIGGSGPIKLYEWWHGQDRTVLPVLKAGNWE